MLQRRGSSTTRRISKLLHSLKRDLLYVLTGFLGRLCIRTPGFYSGFGNMRNIAVVSCDRLRCNFIFELCCPRLAGPVCELNHHQRDAS